MSKPQEISAGKPVPLLVQLKEPVCIPEQIYWYDETEGLNLTVCDGQIKPVVLTPGSLALLKTVTKVGGED